LDLPVKVKNKLVVDFWYCMTKNVMYPLRISLNGIIIDKGANSLWYFYKQTDKNWNVFVVSEHI
jgi:hypothetical protein